MAEMAMTVDPPAPTASLKAPLPALTPLLVITTINGNSRIIPAPAFVPKGLPAALAQMLTRLNGVEYFRLTKRGVLRSAHESKQHQSSSSSWEA